MKDNTSIYLAGTTKDNKKIFYTEEKFKQFSDEQKNLIAEALPHIIYQKFPAIYTYSFNRIVGSTSLVEVEDYQKDNVFWVYRKRNSKWTVPVYFNGVARKTTYMTIVFRRYYGKIFVSNCFFGKRVLPLPSNPYAINKGTEFVERCQSFWQNHALVIPKDEIDISKTLETLTADEAQHFWEIINA